MSDSTLNANMKTGPHCYARGWQRAGTTRNRLMGRPRLFFGLMLLALGLIMGIGNAARAAQLVMFDSEFCPWCLRWKREIGIIYHKTEEGRKAPLRIVDRDGPRPEDLKHIKGIYWTPTFVLLDDQGHEVGRIEGYQNEDSFWFLLGELLKKLDKRRTSGSDKAEPGSLAEKKEKPPANG